MKYFLDEYKLNIYLSYQNIVSAIDIFVGIFITNKQNYTKDMFCGAHNISYFKFTVTDFKSENNNFLMHSIDKFYWTNDRS